MKLLLVVLLVGCADRWNVGVSRGWGELDGVYHDYDTSDIRLEVGLSGPLVSREPSRLPLYPPQYTPQRAAVGSKASGLDLPARRCGSSATTTAAHPSNNRRGVFVGGVLALLLLVALVLLWRRRR